MELFSEAYKRNIPKSLSLDMTHNKPNWPKSFVSKHFTGNVSCGWHQVSEHLHSNTVPQVGYSAGQERHCNGTTWGLLKQNVLKRGVNNERLGLQIRIYVQASRLFQLYFERRTMTTTKTNSKQKQDSLFTEHHHCSKCSYGQEKIIKAIKTRKKAECHQNNLTQNLFFSLREETGKRKKNLGLGVKSPSIANECELYINLSVQIPLLVYMTAVSLLQKMRHKACDMHPALKEKNCSHYVYKAIKDYPCFHLWGIQWTVKSHSGLALPETQTHYRVGWLHVMQKMEPLCTHFLNYFLLKNRYKGVHSWDVYMNLQRQEFSLLWFDWLCRAQALHGILVINWQTLSLHWVQN